MENELEMNKLKKNYAKYNIQMRKKLIKLVQEEKMSTAEAGRIIGIKQTSACRIIHSYRKYHRIFERKADRIERQAQNNQIQKQKTQENSEGNSPPLQFQQKKLFPLQKSQVSAEDPIKLSLSEKTYHDFGFTNSSQKERSFYPMLPNASYGYPWPCPLAFPSPFCWNYPMFS